MAANGGPCSYAIRLPAGTGLAARAGVKGAQPSVARAGVMWSDRRASNLGSGVALILGYSSFGTGLGNQSLNPTSCGER